MHHPGRGPGGPAGALVRAPYHAAQRHRGKVMHIVMFKAPDCVEINHELGDAIVLPQLRDNVASMA